MNFNTDPSKQAHEVIFSGKVNKESHFVLIFVNNKAYLAVIKNAGIILTNVYHLRNILK